MFVGVKGLSTIFCIKYSVHHKLFEIKQKIDLVGYTIIDYMFFLPKKCLNNECNEIERYINI